MKPRCVPVVSDINPFNAGVELDVRLVNSRTEHAERVKYLY